MAAQTGRCGTNGTRGQGQGSGCGTWKAALTSRLKLLLQRALGSLGLPLVAAIPRSKEVLVTGCSGSYTPAMRERLGSTLVLLFSFTAQTQTAPAGWKIIKDGKGACQIAVPPEWVPLAEISGAAIFHDPKTAIAVVTSQLGQQFKPLSPALLRTIGIPKEKMFENSATRIFFQDKTARNPNDTSSFSTSVPAKNGTCSCRVVVLPTIPEDVAKKIVLNLSAVLEREAP